MLLYLDAEVAELADAPVSKSGPRKGVWVRVPPSSVKTKTQRTSAHQRNSASIRMRAWAVRRIIDRFRITPRAGDRLQTKIAAQRQELGMETGAASRTVAYGRLEIVEDQLARTAPEEGQGIDQASVEFGLALRQGELDVEQAAVAEHGHEHRDFAPGRAHLDAAAFAPIDLHGLARLVMHFLVDAAPRRADVTYVAAQNDDTAGIALRSTGDLLMDAHRREVGNLRQLFLDLFPVRIQQAGASRRCWRRRLLHFQGRSHAMSGAVQLFGDLPAGELVDLGKASDFGPQSNVPGVFLRGAVVGAVPSWRKMSPSRMSPWPGSGRRLMPRDGRDSTWTNGNRWAIRSRSSSSSRAFSRTGCDSRNRLVSAWSL